VTSEVRVVTCAGGAAWEAPLVRGLQRRELGIDLVRRCVDHGELLGVAVRDQPRVALVAAELPWLDRDLVGTLHDQGVTVVAIETTTGLRPLERIGVAHHTAADVSPDDLAVLLHRVGGGGARWDDAEPVTGSGARGGGRVVVVWSGPGAPGRTTVAVHLAVEAARRGVEVVLIDGDSWSGSVAQLLGLDESPSVARAARLAGDGWPEPLESCLQRGPDSCLVLPGLARAELWPEVRERAWTGVLEAARERASLVVVDVGAPVEEDEELAFDRVPYRRNVMTLGALAVADDIVEVVAGDPVGLRRGIVAYRAFADARPALARRVSVVLNRAPREARRLQDSSAQLSEWTGRAPSAFLPFEPALARTVWEGRPLHSFVPRSPWLRSLRRVAEMVGA
jgi:MinD-like ATPase involved in chromosome partitioning or flagellar assembly